MPITGAGGQSFQPMSAPFSNNVSNASESSTFTTPGGPATWPPSAASSSVTSLMDSSVTAPITEINLVSSPPTSHAASPSRRSSPLRPSTAGNILESPSVTWELAKSGGIAAPPARLASVAHMEEAYVVNSDPEDGTHAGETDGADTPHILRSPSPTRSQTKPKTAAQTSLAENHLPDDGSSVYVQIPPSSPSTVMPRESSSAKKKPKKQKEQQQQQSEKSRRRGSDASDFDRPFSSSIMDDAAYAAALAAQEETLARRRPTRNARKEVSYQPNCDMEGRPLAPKKDATASGSSSKSKASAKDSSAKKATNKRRSRAFSDDEDEEEHDHNRSATGSSAKAKADTFRMHNDEDDADLTDDDIGFQARDRKKPRVVSNPISIDSGDEDDSSPPKKAKAPANRSSRKKVVTEDEEEEHDQSAAAVSNGGDDEILTPPAPPAPTSPRRSSRKSVPSPKKQLLQEKAKKQAKGRSGKTFDLERAAAIASEKEDEEKEEEEEEQQQQQIRKSPTPKAAEQPPRLSSCPPRAASSSSKSTEFTPEAPASVAIKRITTSTISSPSPSPSTPARGTKSFFGKPLTTLLTPNAARRPGLTRKTKIPSLLNHRGIPKPPVAKLAVSKRRMQDDDYEYDAEYEALIAKDKKGDGESDDDEEEVHHQVGGLGEGDDVEVEYD